MQLEPHILDYLQVLIRRRWIIATCITVIVVIVLFGTLKQTPVYESTTTLFIEPRSPQVISVQEVKPLGPDSNATYKDYYEAQYRLIKGRILLKRVADLLNLNVSNPHQGPNPVDKLLSAIYVKPGKSSQLVEMHVQDTDPSMAAKIANTLAGEYIKQNLERNINAANNAGEWLSKKIEEQRQKLKDAEVALLMNRQKHNINILPQTNGQSANENVSNEYAQLQALYANYSERYTNEHPKMVELKAQINSLRNKVQGLEDFERSNITMEYRVLERQVQTSKDMYYALLSRLKEIDLSSSLNVNNISIVDRAEVPLKPVKPDLKLNMVLAVLVSLLMGIGLGFFADYLDTSVKSSLDVKDIMKSHFLGSIPEVKSDETAEKDKVVYLNPLSPVSEAYRSIRTEILHLMSDKRNPAVLVTSAESQEGKTMTASNIGISLSQKGSSVLIVDTDLRKPQLHRVFHMDRKPGLSEYLKEDLDFNSIIRDTEIENLKIVTSGRTPENPSEILSSSRMKQFILEAKKKFEFVFLDSPPIAFVTDAIILAGIADASIQVVRSGEAHVSIVKRVREKLGNTNSDFLGVILNDLKAYHGDHHYYQYYRYYGEDNNRRKQITKHEDA